MVELYAYASDDDEDPTAEEVGRQSDDTLRDLLEQLLAFRQRAASGKEVPAREAMVAFAFVEALERELITWAGREYEFLCSPTEYAKKSPEERRAMMMFSLRFHLPILQPQARSELFDALQALDIGETAPLLEKSKTGRRRASPSTIQVAQFEILQWIKWQHGLGRRVRDVEAEVTEAVGCTTTALRLWKKELGEAYSPTSVRYQLDCAWELGRYEAAGGVVPEDPIASDERFLLWATSSALERDLGKLVARRRIGMKKRRAPR